MTQAFADDGDIGIVVVRQTGPTVTGHIGGQFVGNAGQLGEFLQLPIVIGEPVAILAIGFVGMLMRQDGKDIIRVVGMIAMDNL